MAPAVALPVLVALVALVAPGLGAAPGCDHPAHRWCRSRDTAVACQVRAAAGDGDRARVTGTRGQGWGQRSLERVAAASVAEAVTSTGMLRATRAPRHSPGSPGNGSGPVGSCLQPLPSCPWHFCFLSVKPLFGLFCPKQSRAVCEPHGAAAASPWHCVLGHIPTHPGTSCSKFVFL